MQDDAAVKRSLSVWFFGISFVHVEITMASIRTFSEIKMQGDAIKTMAWACAICHLIENLLPAAFYSHGVLDLKVSNVTNHIRVYYCLYCAQNVLKHRRLSAA